VKELRARLSKGQMIRKSLKHLWKSHGISIGTKVVWPVIPNGCESGTIRKNEE